MARLNCVVRGVGESPFRGGRAAAKRFKKLDNATAVIWKTLPIAEKPSAGSMRPSCSPTWRAAWSTSTKYVL